MISIILNDGKTEVFLTRVDHTSSANAAALALHTSVMKVSVQCGGTALLHEDDNGFAVQWLNGPTQWADGYVVSDGADARGFAASSEGGDTVIFRDTD